MEHFKLYSDLSKLLSKENIHVNINPNAPTAYFDLKQRILTLPVWDFEPELYSMLIAHEVSHALHTPPHDVWLDPELKSIVNVVEDHRIDKLIKQKFPGFNGDYSKAYIIIMEKNKFGDPEEIKKNLENLDKSTFLNRLCLYLKLTANLDDFKVNFLSSEKNLVKESLCCVTFDDIITVSKKIRDYLKENSKDENNSTDRNGASKESIGEEDTTSRGLSGDTKNSGQQHSSTTRNSKDGTRKTNRGSKKGISENNEDSQFDSSGGTGTSTEQNTSENERFGSNLNDNFNKLTQTENKKITIPNTIVDKCSIITRKELRTIKL